MSEVADVIYRCSAYYDPRSSGASPGTTPTVGIAWPLEDPELSARDRDAPPLADIADAIPFAYPG